MTKKIEPLEARLEKALAMDKTMIKFFKNQYEKRYKGDHIIDITGKTYQCDLVNMPVDPTFPYRYMFVLVNLTNNHVFAEPTERKDADSALKAFKRIMDRYKPNVATLQTDHGGEFKASFHKYCEEKQIVHIYYNLYNKNSMSIVESMNGLISKMIYRTLSILTLKDKKTIDTDHYQTSWVGLLPKVIKTINQYNEEKYPIGSKFTLQDLRNKVVELDKNILRVGDIVYLRMKQATNIVDGKEFFGKKQWRHGDVRFDYLNPKKVTSLFIRSGRPIRYYLDNDNKVSYKRADLLKK